MSDAHRCKTGIACHGGASPLTKTGARDHWAQAARADASLHESGSVTVPRANERSGAQSRRLDTA